MSPKRLTTFRVAPELIAGMRAVKDRDGVPMSVQLDRALRAWLAARETGTKTASRRAPTRRKA